MKKLLLPILFCIHFHTNGQSIFRDSVNGKSACFISLTDSSNQIYSMPLKMHIEVTDKGDNISGAIFSFQIYTVRPNSPKIVFQDQIGISGSYYDNWDANDDKSTYKLVQKLLAGAKIYIDFN
jgi:hypothetical protein